MSDLEVVQRHMKIGPTDVYAILAELGVSTKFQAMRDAVTSTITRQARSGYTVVINTNLSERQKRFAAAHELAHYLLHRDMIPEGDTHQDMIFSPAHKSTSGGIGPFEDAAANRYGFQILLPADQVREAWAGLTVQGQDARIREMTRLFDINAVAMRIRLQSLETVGYMLWMKGIVGLHPTPTQDDVEREANRWYTINHVGGRSGPYRYDTVEEAVRDGKARLHSGRTDFAVTEYDISRESWDVFERPVDAIDDQDHQLDRAA